MTHQTVYDEALRIGNENLRSCITYLKSEPALPQKLNDKLAMGLLTERVLPHRTVYDFFAKICSRECMESVAERLVENNPARAGLVAYNLTTSDS